MSLIIVGSGWLGNRTHIVHLDSFFTIGWRSRDAGQAAKNQFRKSSPLDDLAPACGHVEAKEIFHGGQIGSNNTFHPKQRSLAVGWRLPMAARNVGGEVATVRKREESRKWRANWRAGRCKKGSSGEVSGQASRKQILLLFSDFLFE